MPVWVYLIAIGLFGLLVLLHEAGHYLVARRCGIAVAEFSIGYGPRLWGFHHGGTEWNLRALPLGGYVRWDEEGPGAFAEASLGARAAALLAGPGANLGLTVLLLAVLYGPVQGGGWAGAAGALRGTAGLAGYWFDLMGGLFRGSEELAGPVGIAEMTAYQMVAGADQGLLFVAFLSLNLALFNLMPIPGLDGGRLLFLGLERIRRRALDPGIEGWIHAGGFLGILALVLYTTVKDILA